MQDVDRYMRRRRRGRMKWVAVKGVWGSRTGSRKRSVVGNGKGEHVGMFLDECGDALGECVRRGLKLTGLRREGASKLGNELASLKFIIIMGYGCNEF